MADIIAKHGVGMGESVKETAGLVACGLPSLSTDIIFHYLYFKYLLYFRLFIRYNWIYKLM